MDVFSLVAHLTLDTSEYESGLDESEKKAEGWGGKIGGALGTAAKVGAGAIAAVATVGAAASATIVSNASDVAAFGDNIDKMSQKMGISATAYQEWDAIMQHSGTSIEALKPSMKTLAMQAEKGSEAFQQLGISQEEVASLSQEDLFSRVISGLQGMEEGTERTFITSQLLGKGATELGALLNTSAEDTELMRQRVHELGGVMSDEAVKAAAQYQDSMQDMQTSIDGIKRGLISDFLPSITTVMNGLTAVFSGEDGGNAMLSEGLNGMMEKISSAIPRIMEIGQRILMSLIDAFVQNLPALMSAGTQILIQLATGIISALPSLIASVPQIISAFITAISENVSALVDAAGEMVSSLADGIVGNLSQILGTGEDVVSSLIDGITSQLPEFISSGIDMLMDFIDSIVDMLPEIIETGVQLIVSLAEGLVSALPKLLDKVPEIIERLSQAFIRLLPTIANAGMQLLTALIKNLPSIITTIVAAVPKIVTAIVKAFAGAVPAMVNAGKDLLKGLAKGIGDSIGMVVQKAKEAAGKVLGAVKGFFGISSPSKVMMETGRYIDEGLALGIERNARLVDSAVEGLNNAVDVSYGGIMLPAQMQTIPVTAKKNLTVILELNRTQLAKAVYEMNNEETQRVGVKLAGGFV